MERQWFKAYATGLLVNSPRTPIDAERIVIVLGTEGIGRPVEISISLEKSAKRPDELVVYASADLWFAEVPPKIGELIMHKYPTTPSTGTLAVRYWSTRMSPGDPPA